MNISLNAFTDWASQDDGTFIATKMTVVDNSGLYTGKNITTGAKLFTYCKRTSTGASNSLAVYELVSFTKAYSKYLTNTVFKRLNDTNIDNNVPTVGFLCSNENYIDDIVDAKSSQLADKLITQARTYSLQHMPKDYMEIISVKNIITGTETKEVVDEETGTTTTEDVTVHYISLINTPTEDKVKLDINGVVCWEDDDISVDRDNKKIYFDTDSADNYTFDDLIASADKVRVYYKYC